MPSRLPGSPFRPLDKGGSWSSNSTSCPGPCFERSSSCSYSFRGCSGTRCCSYHHCCNPSFPRARHTDPSAQGAAGAASADPGAVATAAAATTAADPVSADSSAAVAAPAASAARRSYRHCSSLSMSVLCPLVKTKSQRAGRQGRAHLNLVVSSVLLGGPQMIQSSFSWIGV